MPAAIASCGDVKLRGSPAIAMLPRSARCTPPRMRISVDLPAPFSPTSAWISPKSSVEIDVVERAVAPNCLLMPRRSPLAWSSRRIATLTRDERRPHLVVGEFAALDDHVVVERDGAVAHRHVVMALGGALAAALRVRPGGEQEIAGEAARAGVVALRIGAVERDRVPAACGLRPQPRCEMAWPSMSSGCARLPSSQSLISLASSPPSILRMKPSRMSSRTSSCT